MGKRKPKNRGPRGAAKRRRREQLVDSVDEKRSNSIVDGNGRLKSIIVCSEKTLQALRGENLDACTNSGFVLLEKSQESIPCGDDDNVRAKRICDEDRHDGASVIAERIGKKRRHEPLCDLSRSDEIHDEVSRRDCRLSSTEEIHFESKDVKISDSRKLRRRKKKRRVEAGASACETISEKGLEKTSGVELLNDNGLVSEKSICAVKEDTACEIIVEKGLEKTSGVELLNGNGSVLVAEKYICAVKEDVSVIPKAIRSHSRKKLLVLDLNGLLCDVVHGYPRTRKLHGRVGKSAVFKRPFCDDFMKFCCEKFDIGVWSSRKMENVQGVVDFIMRDIRDKLLFCWDASKCTYTGSQTIEDRNKPLVLKQLKKVWDKEDGDLPWEKGDYSPSNTLLLDDSPYKALCNPLYTGVFPYPYSYTDDNDHSLGPGGDLRVYLEGLALADDVQCYVKNHPFGRRAITSSNPSWIYYEQIINKITMFSNSSANAR